MAWLMWAVTATCFTRSANSKNTVNYPEKTWRNCRRANGSKWTTPSKTRWILSYGKWRSRVSRAGNLPGAWDAQVGISNVRLCRPAVWAITSTFTAEAWICSFLIMKTKSHNRKVQPANNLSMFGCITVLFGLTKKKCPNRWVISSRYERFSSSTGQRSSAFLS